MPLFVPLSSIFWSIFFKSESCFSSRFSIFFIRRGAFSTFLRCASSSIGVAGAAFPVLKETAGVGIAANLLSTTSQRELRGSFQSSSRSPRASMVTPPSRTVRTCVGCRASRKVRSWLMTRQEPGNSLSAVVSVLIVPTSRWFEGSSSSSRLCGMSTKLAKATRAFSPPDRSPTTRMAFSPTSPSAPSTDLARSSVREVSNCLTADVTTSTARALWSRSCARS
mmetsp:Transcript_7425/g.16274  ORF Transcript_7425/g.16274 Transcript_7425/m.16274 type:complete len:223 (+) Transcript_7425:195-863(+)